MGEEQVWTKGQVACRPRGRECSGRCLEETGVRGEGVQLWTLEGGLEANRLESECRPVRTQHQGHVARVPAQLQLCFSAASNTSLPRILGNKP